MSMLTRVRTPEQRLRVRERAAVQGRISAVQLLCCVSILRTALATLVPLAGGSAWWITGLCLLPGIAVYGLLRGCLALTGTKTIGECARVCLGRAGAWCVSLLLAAVLLADAAATLTALITLFTEGIGTRGTQLTLALLTAAVLLCCLDREGLPRAVFLLRRGLVGTALLLILFLLRDVRGDHLFPLMGEGTAAIRASLRAGFGLGWPLILLLNVAPAQGMKRSSRPLLPMLLCCLGALLFLTLIMPHELLARGADLAGSLITPVRYATPAMRTLGLCLMMLTFFLAVAVALRQATDCLCAPAGRTPGWLPHAVMLLLTATQALDIRRVWGLLTAIAPFLLLPFAALGAVLLPIALYRRHPE